MDQQPPETPPAFRFSDPRQERIHRRLLLVGPGPAAFYRDVCRFMAGTLLAEATTHLVAHLLRDIESAIRDVLIPYDYSTPSEKQGRFKREIDAILKAYGIADDDPVARLWRGLPDRDDERWLGRLAHRRSLGAPRGLDEEFRQFVTEVEAVFDVVLQRFEGRFLSSLPLIDGLLAKSVPTESDIKTLRGRVPNNLITFEYFFSRVAAPQWLELLAAGNFFAQPPDPVPDAEKGVTRFPPWPQSRYLARMAAVPALQARVIEIALTIPDTQNINVHEDVVRIALAVPPPLAARLMPRVRLWLESPYQLRLLHRIGDLVRHLASGGESEAALELAAAFLKIVPDPDVREVTVGDQKWRMPPHPRTAHDEWLVQEFLRETLPVLLDAAGMPALELVCRALDDVVRLSRSRPDEEGPQDYSTVWRPAIEDHAGNLENELKSMLVGAVRESAERLIERDPARIGEIIALVEAHHWTVFQRIGLHLLRDAADSALSFVEQRLRDKERFGGRGQKREYVLLVQKWFSRLAAQTQRTILGWIDDGPEVDGYRRMRAEIGGEPPTEAELTEYADRWRLEHLRALRDVLPGRSQERYQALVERYGEPETPDFLSVRVGAITHGPESPITAAELRQTPIVELISRLKAWQPTGEFLGPSPEGLSRALASAVEEEPARFAAGAEGFEEVEPTYVRGVITGLRDAVKKERPFDWALVLKLCQWVVDQPVAPDDGGGPFERDRGWQWTRKAIADLLEDGLGRGPCQMPFALREDVWKVLRRLTDDLDPAPTVTVDGHESEPLGTAINSTRGEAMQAVVRYALWVKEHVGRVPDESLKEEVTLRQMLEVREVLEAHLDPIRDPSPAIRAVYGRWLPWLVHIDPEWVKANLTKIFPTDESLARLRDAAWNTYVVYCPVYNNVGDVLKEEYARAAERIGRMQRDGRSPADPADHLAEHLMVLYRRGKIELDGPELTDYYAAAPDDVRGHAMWFVGRVFAKDGEEPPVEIVDRLKRLFESRLAAIHVAPVGHRKELEQFGSWFASGKFGDEWSLTNLQEVLRLVGSAEPDSLVMDQLVKLAPLHSTAVVECARLMVEGAGEYWKIEAWRNEIRQIIRIARHGSQKARDAAETLVNILGARGHLEFRDLLED